MAKLFHLLTHMSSQDKISKSSRLQKFLNNFNKANSDQIQEQSIFWVKNFHCSRLRVKF